MTHEHATHLVLPSDRELELRRFVAAPRRAIFGAWTDARLVPQWLLGPPGWTMPVCEIDLRVGGRWRFVYRRDDGTTMELSGKYLEILPPMRLVSTECWGGDWPETQNTLQLGEAPGGAALSMSLLYPDREARDRALATGMKDGVAASFERLDALLAPQASGADAAEAGSQA